jgi:hypothetical protein
MFGSAVLELAIGMCLLYLMFGGLCSTLREYVARLLSQRETTLVAALASLLGTPTPSDADIHAQSATDAKTTPASDGSNLAARVLGHQLIRGLTEPGKHPSYIPARTFALALLDVLSPEGKTERTLESVRATVAQIEPAKVREALLPLVTQPAQDLAQLQASIARHFDDAMDRASGAYKRNSQKVIALIALCVTIAFNVDSFSAAKTLWATPGLRAAAVQQAETAVKAGIPSGSPSASELERLPIGWYGLPKDGQGWLLKGLGWLVTAFALTLGTPFWFDLLTRLVNLRAAGPKPPRSDKPAAD